MPDEKDNSTKNKGPWGDHPPGSHAGRPAGGMPPGPDLDKLFDEGRKKVINMLKKGSNGGSSGNQGGGGGNTNKPGQPVGSASLRTAALIVGILIWLASGVYTVNTKEAGIVTRFGQYTRTTTPGLNYHLPYPIEQVIKLNVTERYRTEIGANADKSRYTRGNAPDDLLMLTGDENLVDVSFEVQWQIDDAQKFLFNIYDPAATVRNAAESAMREVVGTTPLSDTLSEGRTILQQKTKELLQSVLDSYNSGIRVEAINMRGVPPTNSIQLENLITSDNGEVRSETITTTVAEAFKDVQAAIINKEEIINTAIARSNEVIPEARGQAQKLIQEAQGYKEQVIAKAEGEAKRFTSIYNEYKKSPDVTQKRMYLETMEQVLEGMDKIIVNDSNGVVPYLPLKELGNKQ